MSSTKTTGERIDTLQEKIQQLENQKKQLLQKQKADERKARTKRLIERGAILESLISDAGSFSNEQIKAFLEKTVQSDFAKKIFAEITTQDGIIAAEKTPWDKRVNGTATAEKAMGTERGGD